MICGPYFAKKKERKKEKGKCKTNRTNMKNTCMMLIQGETKTV